MNQPKRLVVLGSTGSVGTQTMDVAARMGLPVLAIGAASNITLLEAQIRAFAPQYCAVLDETAARTLADRVADTATRVLAGASAFSEIAALPEADLVLNSVMGSAGVAPTLAAIRAGKNVALANKETLVTAGEIVMREARAHHVQILPVDSEHSAIFQCLSGGKTEEVSRLILTASGGPFFGKKRAELVGIGVAETMAHPTWQMGAKITVDSATMMNKGFEVIEAVHLFGVTPDKVDVVVHRESIIHSMVEYCDGVVLAQLGAPDMRTCIQHAITYPDRMPGSAEKLDFARIGNLSFYPPDTEAFPLLALAFKAIRAGGVLPAAMNGANERAVARFLKGELSFLQIAELVTAVVEQAPQIANPTLADFVETDNWARERLDTLAQKQTTKG